MSAAASLPAAMELHRAQRLDEAAALYRAILAADPDNLNALNLLATLLRQQNRPAEALPLARRAAALLPESRPLWHGLAHTLKALERFVEAAAALERAFRLSLGDVAAALGLAQELYDVPAFPEAERAARRLLARPDLTADQRRTAHEILGTLLAEMRRYPEARAHLRAVIAAGGETSRAQANLGFCFGAEGDYEAAERLCRAVPEGSPGHGFARFHLARALSARRQPEQSLQQLWVHNRGGPAPSVRDLLDRIDAVVPPSVPRERSLIDVLGSLRHVGHLCQEPFFLRAAHPDRHIVLVVGKPDIPGCEPCNPEIVAVATAGATLVETDDPFLLGLRGIETGRIERGDRIYFLHNPFAATRDYFYKRRSGLQGRPFSLSDAQRERGDAVARRMGVPEAAPVVVMHVREPGYHGTLYQLRNASVHNYLPTVRHLVASGYVVVRLGDRSMTPLPDLGPQVIDAPFRPEYEPVVDPYFIGRCAFMVANNSGPVELARSFLKPIVATNSVTQFPLCPTALELYSFKKYLDTRAGGRPLPLREIFERQLSEIPTDRMLRGLGIALQEMTAEEILASCREMQDILRRHPEAAADAAALPLSEAQRRWRAAAAREHAQRVETALERRWEANDWYGLSLPNCVLSDSWCQANPWFLD